MNSVIELFITKKTQYIWKGFSHNFVPNFTMKMTLVHWEGRPINEIPLTTNFYQVYKLFQRIYNI